MKPEKKPKEKTKEKRKLPPMSIPDVRKLISSLDGKNPDTEQSLNEFLKLDSNVQKTTLPTRNDVHRVGFLLYAGASLYPDDPEDPFTQAADCIAISFMPYKGEKAKQFVELFRNVPNVVDLQTQTNDARKSWLERIRGDTSNE